jgi:DNA-binding transcriptional LysR family regulator
MMKLEGIAAFVAIVDAGSVSEAARRLGWSKSVTSERLAGLERVLGTRLVQRTTRKLSLTQDGDSLLPRARRILADVDDAAVDVVERRGSLAGRSASQRRSASAFCISVGRSAPFSRSIRVQSCRSNWMIGSSMPPRTGSMRSSGTARWWTAVWLPSGWR